VRGWFRKKMEDLVVAGHCTQDDDETGGLPPLPTRVFLSLLPPGAGIGVGRDEVPTSLTARPLIDDPEPNRAPRTTITAPARGPTTPASFTAPPAPPYPRRGGETPAKLFPLLSDAIS